MRKPHFKLTPVHRVDEDSLILARDISDTLRIYRVLQVKRDWMKGQVVLTLCHGKGTVVLPILFKVLHSHGLPCA